jgi:CRISPR-associated endonuclease/helicase Cas3
MAIDDSLRVERFWGKLGHEEEATGFHPLICHMIDVAAVAERMWDDIMTPAARRRLADALGLEESAARRWVAFLAGLHDTGKCCPSFTLRPGAERLSHLYVDCRPNPRRGDPKAAPHGEVTALALPAALEGRFGVPREVATTLAAAIGGHHGFFPSHYELNKLAENFDAVGEGCWAAMRGAHVERLATLLGIDAVPAPTRLDRTAPLTLAGLVSVADWIGSMEEFFPYLVTDPANIPPVGADYVEQAREQAERALRELHWTGWTPGAGRPSFAEMFGGREPRPMQEAAITLAERLAGPGLVVIEAPMGEGKTEAALYLADRWGLEPGARGMYLALPTQATSNQMFGRLQTFLEQRYPTDTVNLQLLHGQADLRADFAELKQRDAFIPRLTPDGEDAGKAGVVAAGWFAQRKRGLLAPFGVGTVDQALLAVLRTRHVFIRLYGLTSRVVVIDEVHAYDTYMTALIERLLEWLAALGSPVVLLSATLPRQRRDALMQAYYRGLTGLRDAAPEEPYEPYPRMTWVLARPGQSPEVDADPLAVSQSGRTLRLRWQDGRLPDAPGEPFPLGEQLRHALTNGGCAAVICNTVRRAQEVYTALTPYFSGEASDGLPALDLFHARFLQRDRAEREERALTRFGPGVERPDRAVLVATQVIEQSLDLDFDLMVTDFAPVDLMLQRAGRLWRHARPWPEGITEPELWVCAPERDEDGLPRFPGGDALIYDEHVLLRSWLALRGVETVTLPDDIERLVEAVYADQPPPEDLTPAERGRWETPLEDLIKSRAEERDEAKARWLPGPNQDVELEAFTKNARAEDEPGFHQAHQALTRLAEPSVTVVFLYGDRARPALDPGGTSTNPQAKPGPNCTRELLLRSVSLQSPRGLVSHLLHREETPRGWQRSPHLRNARLIVLDADSEAEVGGYRIRLDPDLGVRAEKIGSRAVEQA